MSSHRNMPQDDFDIESKDRYDDRHRTTSGNRSRSGRRSYSRHRDGSRSRSRSHGRRSGNYRRNRRSRSRSRSRSRGYSRRRSDVSRHSQKRRDSQSESNSRSRSRSPSYNRRKRDRDYDNGRDHKRRNSKSRSRSKSRTHDSQRGYNDRHKSDKRSLKVINEKEAEDSSSNDTAQHPEKLEDLPLPGQTKAETKPIYQFGEDEPIDRERIHKEMEEKLRQALAKEGKVYPPPKPEASHPVFANDGSFLEIFKKMQQQQQGQAALQPKPSTSVNAVSANLMPAVPILAANAVNPATAPYLVATAMGKSAPPPPIVGRRKGGKILKTGVVAKPKVQTDSANDPKDFWSLYLAEVNKYKNTACESEQGNRPLVK